MAFFAAFGSSIGKKLLLFGLRHYDILDKDPADFVSVDVGRKTTLEVRDVGLHVKKLVALLHLKLPPELHVSTARASFFRVTVLFEFGVPQISIEVGGVQLHARLAETPPSTPPHKQPRATADPRAASPAPSDDGSDADIPDVDQLAQSFLREEPEEEIKVLEEALHAQTQSLQASAIDNSASSDDEDDEDVGLGAPLGLPGMLRNLFNTALDRLEVVVSDIDIEVEDQLPPESPDATQDQDEPFVSLNFHVKRISMDSVEPKAFFASASPSEDKDGKLGKRRMRIENICARLISDAENFDTMSRFSVPPSPMGTRSVVSSPEQSRAANSFSPDARSEGSSYSDKLPLDDLVSSDEPVRESIPSVAASRDSVRDLRSVPASANLDGYSSGELSVHESLASSNEELGAHRSPVLAVQDPSVHDLHLSATHESSFHDSLASVAQEPALPSASHLASLPLESSAQIPDEDRFADADSDTLGRSYHSDDFDPASQPAGRPEMSASSILYDDHGLLDHVLESDLMSQELEPENDSGFLERSQRGYGFRNPSDPSEPASVATQPSSPYKSSPSIPFHSSDGLGDARTLSKSVPSQSTPTTTDNLKAARHRLAEQHADPDQYHIDTASHLAASPPEEDLTESKVFTHDEAASMYMSALSGGVGSTFNAAIPGGWESSNSSQSTSTQSDSSAPIPEHMLAGSILEPAAEPEGGTETPRPASPQSTILSPQTGNATGQARASSDGAGPVLRLAKTLLTVDQVLVWFPLGLSDQNQPQQDEEEPVPQPELSFDPPNLTQDSIFQDMPGSFSSYAFSSHMRRRGSLRSKTASTAKPPTPSPGGPKSPSAPRTPQPAIISVEVGRVAAHMDFATGRIMFRLVERVLKALTAAPDTRTEGRKRQDAESDSHSSLDVSVRSVGISWLESPTAEPLVRNEDPWVELPLDPPDAILRARLLNVHALTHTMPEGVKSKIQIGRIVLSSLDQEVIAFQPPKAKSKRSGSSSADVPSNDIEVVIEKTIEDRITVVTRPVKMTFDLEKLDEALSSFGGFSGILEFGSSMSSTYSANAPVTPVISPRPRGVHFGDAAIALPPKQDTSDMPKTKVDVQLGDITFLLKAKSCAIRLQTTSVRAAIRENNVRLKIAEIMLSGPHLDTSSVGAPLILEVKSIAVHFLFAPEESDLTKLISMITPSKDPYENDEDILVDTLLRQRRKGSVLRIEVANVGLRLSDPICVKSLQDLGAEVSKFSKVTKYLPDDDRPGILTLVMAQQFQANITVNDRIRDVSVKVQDAAIAHVGVPALLALELGTVAVNREEELLVHEVVNFRTNDQLPMVMARIIGDEMEPLVKAKLFNVCVEYHVSTVMAALGLSEEGTADDIALGLASSVATITGASSPKTLSRQGSQTSTSGTSTPKPLHIDLLLRSCALGLNPRNISSKALFVMTDAHFLGKQSRREGYRIEADMRKASIHLIDDYGRIPDRELANPHSQGLSAGTRQLLELREQGFVSMSSISEAKAEVMITGDCTDQPQSVAVEFKNKLFTLETCADSTQTFIAVMNGLQPPRPPNTTQRYRTVVPLQEMMASFTGDAMAAPDLEPGEEDNFMDNADLVADDVPTNLQFVGSMYNSSSLPTGEDLGDSMLDEDDLDALAPINATRPRGAPPLLASFQEQAEVTGGEVEFDMTEDYIKDTDSEFKGHARKWSSKENKYHLENEFKVADSPLTVRVRDVNVVWHLYDGYDWPRTRGIIAQAVEDVEARAEERRRRPHDFDEDDEDFVEQDFLFNSVWIGVPVKDEKGALARRINHDIDDLVSETGSYATSTATRTTTASGRPRSSTNRRKLKLGRSKNKKIAFDLEGIAIDLVVFPPDSGETQNSLSVRVKDFTIYDHVPTSTWNKFVTSMIEPSKRELDKAMVNLEVLTVKPVNDLAASELVIKVRVLPLRLHVDQDALDFITRFFEFKDESAPSSAAPSDQPFIQRLEVMAVKLKLDYKPKRVDYGGLRSGHTTEFMNFMILDGSDILLRHAIVYGLTSFDKIHMTLNDVWMPDVKANQLPAVLSGLSAVRPFVNVGSGVRDLVVVPMREYKKDGRIVRSLQKGVFAFAKTTTSEVARLGAKVAIGTQSLLEGAEKILNPQSSASPRSAAPALHDWDDIDADAEENEQRARSNYANQPLGVRSGLRSAARHLERDLLTARDAIIAIPAEVMEEGTGVGMARAIARRAPTVILRPALGATKAVSHALLGVGNALDGDSGRKIDDKYKSY